jgi:hypothetical protein
MRAGASYRSHLPLLPQLDLVVVALLGAGAKSIPAMTPMFVIIITFQQPLYADSSPTASLGCNGASPATSPLLAYSTPDDRARG